MFAEFTGGEIDNLLPENSNNELYFISSRRKIP
jgi:hypothetical protein